MECDFCENWDLIKRSTYSKSHTSRNSHFLNRIFSKIHIFKITNFNKNHIFKISIFTKITFQIPFLTKITFSKSHFSLKSIIVSKNIIFKISFFIKITYFETSNSSEFMDKKVRFCPSVKSLAWKVRARFENFKPQGENFLVTKHNFLEF